MFVPTLYLADEIWHRRIIRDHPLATLVTNGAFAPYATRLPALIAPGTPEETPLKDIEIIGHMNRANPHWSALADGTPARLMFDGPSGFVTPAAYRTEPASPTWDFIAVHVTGRLRLVRGREKTLQVVCWTAQTLESRFGEKWDHASSIGYFREILPGVGAFRMEIDSVEGMFKLSQEKPREIQESVIRWFESDRTGAHGRLARLMREFGIGDPTASGPAEPAVTQSAAGR
jgi:transcriptional regulator